MSEPSREATQDAGRKTEMAKRTASGQPRARRSKANDITTQPGAQRADELPNIPEPGDSADAAQRSEARFYESITVDSPTPDPLPNDPAAAQSLTSESMASEPSEADIRLRAYQRYLERGGTHGGHVDDWFAAREELRDQRVKSHHG